MTGSRPPASRAGSVIPGLGLSLGTTVLWVSLIVLVPLASLTLRPFTDGPGVFLHVFADPRTRAALRLSFLAALAAAAIATVLGLLLAWVIVRVRAPGARLLDAIIDLPFALPTAVAGITLTGLYAPHGWIGALLAPLGIRIAYQPAGIVLALVFVGIPFAVRSAVPVLRALDPALEEAAATLGARSVQIVRRVLLPVTVPALATGFALAFARGVGEYGSVIFIAGNRPGISEIAPLLIVIRLQEFDYEGAAAIGLVMLLLSVLCLLLIDAARRRITT